MDRAFGGLIQNDAPLVCGGFTTESESKCYLVGLDEVVAELNRPRDSGASVVLQNGVHTRDIFISQNPISFLFH